MADAPEASVLPKIAILGAGIFVRTQYIPRLREITDIFSLKAIWSRTEESARAAADLARDFAPDVECKWGEDGLEDIAQDRAIDGVAVVLAGQVQVDISLRMLKAGKHVIQEKPAAQSTGEAETAISCYNSMCNLLTQPIWAVAENYRFEPAFVEGGKLVKDIGDMMNVHVVVEGSMNDSNPYFSSAWRRIFLGGFILDMGVHFVAGLRLLAGCEISSLSAIARHVDTTLPPPDSLCSLFQLENGCAGVFVLVVSSKAPKIYFRVDGSKGSVQVERGTGDNNQGYVVSFFSADGQRQDKFYPFSEVTDELKAFAQDIFATRKDAVGHKPDPRSSFLEGARDLAVLEAMLESSAKQGDRVHVKGF